MKTPSNVHGRDFANHLIRRWNFREVRQTGSHIILRTEEPMARTVSVPAHKPLRPGTFRNLLEDVAAHKNTTVAAILHTL